jgi:hypothetical protein
MRETVEATAGEQIAFGSFVVIDAGIARHDPSGQAEGGLALRPAHAGATPAYEPGETMTILRTGGALGLFDAATRWAEIRKGRLLPRESEEWEPSPRSEPTPPNGSNIIPPNDDLLRRIRRWMLC